MDKQEKSNNGMKSSQKHTKDYLNKEKKKMLNAKKFIIILKLKKKITIKKTISATICMNMKEKKKSFLSLQEDKKK